VELRNALRGTVGGNEKNRDYATLGTRKEQIKGFIDEINKLDESHFHEKNFIGRVQEYFLRVFAIDAEKGTEKGEFYTPTSIVSLIAVCLYPHGESTVQPQKMARRR
jgi:type I restriction enzyme M protein